MKKNDKITLSREWIERKREQAMTYRDIVGIHSSLYPYHDADIAFCDELLKMMDCQKVKASEIIKKVEAIVQECGDIEVPTDITSIIEDYPGDVNHEED